MKYGPEITKAICEHIALGVIQRDAAALEDISEETFYQWMRVHPEFSEAIKKARLEDKARSIKLITKAGLKSWQANAWKLERGYPEDYALRAKLEHTGRNGGPIQTSSRRYDFRDTDDKTLQDKAFKKPPQKS